jgi:hypothetical protein
LYAKYGRAKHVPFCTAGLNLVFLHAVIQNRRLRLFDKFQGVKILNGYALSGVENFFYLSYTVEKKRRNILKSDNLVLFFISIGTKSSIQALLEVLIRT